MKLEDLTDEELDGYVRLMEYINESLCKGIRLFNFSMPLQDSKPLGIAYEKFLSAQWDIQQRWSKDGVLTWIFQSLIKDNDPKRSAWNGTVIKAGVAMNRPRDEVMFECFIASFEKGVWVDINAFMKEWFWREMVDGQVFFSKDTGDFVDASEVVYDAPK